MACFDIMSVWLLAGEYLDTGDRRLLGMALAYLWSLLLMGGYALAFPGVVSQHPPLAVTASVAPYLYLGWHVGFPVLLGAAWGPWDWLDRTEIRRRPARLLSRASGDGCRSVGHGDLLRAERPADAGADPRPGHQRAWQG